jgi:hypothetical protein
MKVQVTKDSFGVIVWPENEEIVYGNNINWQSNMYNESFHKPIKWIPGWIRKKFTLFQSSYQIFTSKEIAKYMPELGKDMQNGEIKTYELTIKEIN